MICLLPERSYLLWSSESICQCLVAQSSSWATPRLAESFISRALSNIFNIIILCNSKTFLLVLWTLHYTTFWGLSAQDGTTWTAVNPPNISAVSAGSQQDHSDELSVSIWPETWMYSCTTQSQPCGPILPDTSALCCRNPHVLVQI